MPQKQELTTLHSWTASWPDEEDIDLQRKLWERQLDKHLKLLKHIPWPTARSLDRSNVDTIIVKTISCLQTLDKQMNLVRPTQKHALKRPLLLWNNPGSWEDNNNKRKDLLSHRNFLQLYHHFRFSSSLQSIVIPTVLTTVSFHCRSQFLSCNQR